MLREIVGGGANLSLARVRFRPPGGKKWPAREHCKMPVMANIASLLKAEISRVARKQTRGETLGLKQALSTCRSEIVALKRRTQALEADLRRLLKASARSAPVQTAEPASRAMRFSAKGLVSQRKRLGLSAQDCGLLVGASGQSVYNWEDGKARPRAKHLQALAALRDMGKKEAAARLAELKAASAA
jgi:DNA-binding transcriptional regulator YiaG